MALLFLRYRLRSSHRLRVAGYKSRLNVLIPRLQQKIINRKEGKLFVRTSQGYVQYLSVTSSRTFRDKTRQDSSLFPSVLVRGTAVPVDCDGD